MRSSHLRALTVAAAASFLLSAAPARADNGTGDVFEQSIVPGANAAIKNAMDEEQRRRETARRQAATLKSGTVAQAPPISQQPIAPQIGLPTGFTYQADLSVAYPYGNIGSLGKGWLMGGGDLSLGYGFNSTTKLVASMFQIQHWAYGFNSGLVPVYLAGFRNPVGCADLTGGNACGAGTGAKINVASKDTFGVFMLEKLFVIHGPRPIPIVISPAYVTRGGQVGESPTFNDVVPFAYNPPDGPVFTDLATRTAQYYAVAVTLPFLKTSKMFGTFTVAPQWLVHTNGVNTSNSAQLTQVLDLEYYPFKGTTVFFEPQSARDYLPTDPYPEHLVAYFLGISQRVTKYSFVQLVLNSGGPTNMGPDGVTAIKCLTVQQALNDTCGIAIGGLRATQLQLQFGIGSPSVFPL